MNKKNLKFLRLNFAKVVFMFDHRIKSALLVFFIIIYDNISLSHKTRFY